MPNAITAIFGADARPYEREIARAEAIATGFSKRMGNLTIRNFPLFGSSSASLTQLKSQLAVFDNFKATVDRVRGTGMMSAEESAEHEERMRQIEVEAAARRNAARALLAERAAAREAESTAESVEDATRANMARRLWRERAAAREAYKAAELAMISDIARAGGVAGNLGGGSHSLGAGGTGFAGVIRESLVILREASRGNWTRMAGSVTLLAQYTGLLGTVIKSSASEAVKQAQAMNAAAAAAARQALAEESLGTANIQAATTARAAAVAAAEQAEAATAAAETQLAMATTSLGPIGWLAAAVIAVGVAFTFVWREMRKSNEEMRNAAEISDVTRTNFRDEAEAIDKAADAAKNFSLWLGKLHEKQEGLASKSNDATQAIKDQADAAQKLADAQKEAALAQLDEDEKAGRISHRDAIEKRAKIESDAVKKKSDAEMATVQKQIDQRKKDYDDALTAQIDAENAAKGASAAIQSPQGIAKAEALNAAKRKVEEARKVTDAVESAVKASKSSILPWNVYGDNTPLDVTVDGKSYHGSLNYWKGMSGYAQSNLSTAESNATPQEQALAKAKEDAENAKNSRVEIGKDLDKLGNQYNALKQNADALVSAEQAAIESRKRTELLGNQPTGGFGLNSQQQRGAYAATPPDWQRLVDATVRTAKNTDNLNPGNRTPGPTGARHGAGVH